MEHQEENQKKRISVLNQDACFSQKQQWLYGGEFTTHRSSKKHI
jgi:hypothetical protein